MEQKDIWVENTVTNFIATGVYHRYVEVTEDSNTLTLTEEATYSPVVLEVEHLQDLKAFISGGYWRKGDDPSPSWMWYLLVPKGETQDEGWFPLPCLWDLSPLTPNLIEIKEHLEMLMAEV